MYSAYFNIVNSATLTDLHRKTAEVIRPVIRGNQEVVIHEHGKACAKIVPMGFDRKKVFRILREMGELGPIELPSRK